MVASLGARASTTMTIHSSRLDLVLLDAIVLAGGRSSRLSGVPKAMLIDHGITLLDTAVDAAASAGARHIIVVGDALSTLHPDRVIAAREDPPFGGPAAAIAAGIDAISAANPATLPFSGSDGVIVLACDLPGASIAMTTLIAALPFVGDDDGVVAVDDTGRHQLLTALYRRSALAGAVTAFRACASVDGASVRALLGGLTLRPVIMPEGATGDIDTAEDALRHGIQVPGVTNEIEMTMAEDDEQLAAWTTRLVAALGRADFDLDSLEVDIDAVLSLAGKAAHAVIRPAAPLTTFIVGYAAGFAAARGTPSADAIGAATRAALEETQRVRDGDPSENDS